MAKHGKKYNAALAKVDLDKGIFITRRSCTCEGDQYYQVRFNGRGAHAHRP